jgi:hypothetical protein
MGGRGVYIVATKYRRIKQTDENKPAAANTRVAEH